MYQKGEYLVYGSNGVCEVTDITTLEIHGASKNRLYYILCPLNNNGTKIYVPVDSEKVKLRSLMTKEEAEELINQIPNISEIWIKNDKLREAKYKELVGTFRCADYVKIIKTLYLRKQQRNNQGKKLTSTDMKYLKIAEDALYSELSISISIPKENMEDYITHRIEQNACLES